VIGDNGLGSNFSDPAAEAGGVVQVSMQIYGSGFAPPSLAMSKTSVPAEVVVGSAFQYVIDVSNISTEDAALVTVSDTLPAGVTLLAPLPFGCIEPIVGTVNCSLGTLGPGASAQIVLNVQAPNTPGTLTNTASASSEGSSSVAADAQTLVFDSNADVSVNKFSNFPEAEAGEELFAYSIHFSNEGPGTANEVTLTDPLPEGMLFEHVTTTEGACSHDVATNTVNCALGDLPPGRVGLVMISATPVQVGQIINTVSIVATGPDPVPENNVSSAETNVVLSSASVTDTVNAADDRLLDFGLIALGQSATGNLSVTNTGTTPLSIGNVLNPLQPPFSIVSAGCFGATLLPGESCSVIIQFSPVENGPFSERFDLQLDSIAVPVTVSGSGGIFSTDIAVTKEVDDDDLSVGDVANFIITVRNLGNGATGGVTAAVKVTDKLPAPLRIPDGEAAAVSKGLYSPSTGEWFVGDLAVGETATLEIPAIVASDPPGGRHCIKNVAVAEITNPDVTEPANRLFNNRSEIMLSIGGCADVSVGSDVDQDFQAYLPLDRDGPVPGAAGEIYFRYNHPQYPLGHDCSDCVLSFVERFPDVRYIGYLALRKSSSNNNSEFVVLDVNLRDDSSGAFNIHANPGSCDGISFGGVAIDYCIEIAFRSSELGSIHSGVLEIQYIFLNDPATLRVAEVNLEASVVEDFGTVQWDIPLFNDGPGEFETPFAFLVDLPFGATFNRLTDFMINTDSHSVLNGLTQHCTVEQTTFRGKQRERLICTATHGSSPFSFGCHRESHFTCRIGILANVTGVFSGGLDMSFCSVTEDPQHNNNGPDRNLLFGQQLMTADGLTMECPR
jgi:uncharacterized repeat protein (TIGR01451 family)